MNTQVAPANVDARLHPVAVLGVSVVLLASLIVAASALGTSLLGVPTYYGNGVDSTLGAKVARDFLADQQAEAIALSNGDQAPLGSRFTDSALADLIQQISSQSPSGRPPTVSFQPASLTVLRAPDPADPTLTIEIQEEGTKTVVSTPGPDAAPTEQKISFHGDFWLRVPSGGHYAIADMNVQTLPSSPLPALAVVGAALVVVGLTVLLLVRQRARRPTLGQAAAGQPPEVAPSIETSADVEDALEPPGPARAMVVSTFGGLHVREGGRDWAQELMSRPVTGFVWLRLLVGAIRDPLALPGRDEIARQTTPGLGRDVQLKRLRNIIGKGLREMPAPLGNRILVEPEVMSFRLEGCQVDAVDLLSLSVECARRSHLTDALAARAQRLLQACQGTFLPEFEAIEDLATDRHPTCTALVSELRELLTNKRVELALLLAETHLRAGRPTQAIAVLVPALSDRSERKDIADRLAAAYRVAGREGEAKALEARYA